MQSRQKDSFHQNISQITICSNLIHWNLQQNSQQNFRGRKRNEKKKFIDWRSPETDEKETILNKGTENTRNYITNNKTSDVHKCATCKCKMQMMKVAIQVFKAQTLQNMLIEKFWSNSCWNICGGFIFAPLPGRDQLCFTGGRTACLSFLMILDWSAELDDRSLGKLPASPTESLGTRKLAIAPNALGLGGGADAASFSRPVFPKTAC